MVAEIILDYLHLALLGDVLGGLDVLEDLDVLVEEAVDVEVVGLEDMVRVLDVDLVGFHCHFSS